MIACIVLSSEYVIKIANSEDDTCHFNIGQARNACLCLKYTRKRIESQASFFKIKVETKRRHNNGQGCLDCLLDEGKIGSSFLKHYNPVESVEYTELFLVVGNKGLLRYRLLRKNVVDFDHLLYPKLKMLHWLKLCQSFFLCIFCMVILLSSLDGLERCLLMA